jgi:hypothetical protein
MSHFYFCLPWQLESRSSVFDNRWQFTFVLYFHSLLYCTPIYSWTIEQIDRHRSSAEDHTNMSYYNLCGIGSQHWICVNVYTCLYVNKQFMIDHNINPVSSIKYQCGWINIWSIYVHFNEFWISIFAYMNIFVMRTMILCHRNEKK